MFATNIVPHVEVCVKVFEVGSEYIVLFSNESRAFSVMLMGRRVEVEWPIFGGEVIKDILFETVIRRVPTFSDDLASFSLLKVFTLPLLI